MPLSLLAKDSIQDLASLATSQEENKEEVLGETTTTTTTTTTATTALDAAAAEAAAADTETSVVGQVTVTPVLVDEEETVKVNNNNNNSNSDSLVGISSSGEETGHSETQGSNTNHLYANENSATLLLPQRDGDEDETEVADNYLSGTNNSNNNNNDENNAHVVLPNANNVDNVEEHAANPQQAQEEEDEQQPAAAASAYYQRRYHYGATQASTQQQLQQQHHLHGDEHMDDSDSSYYYHDTYAPTVLGQSASSSQPFFPKLIFCLFPWMARQEERRVEASYESSSSSSSSSVAASFVPQTYEQQVAPGNSTAAAAAAATTTSATASSTAAEAATATTISDKGNSDNQKTTTPPRSEDDECSSGSDALGEKLSAKERQAVLARLGLARPEQEATQSNYFGKEEDSTSSSTQDARKGLLNGIPTYDTSPLEEDMQGDATKKLKGILKKRGSLVDLEKVRNTSAGSSISSKQGRKDEDTSKRRSLFPSYKSSAKTGINKHARFAPMARVVTVKSKNDMLPEEKADIWWQKTDYEDFRKTGRIITKAMLEGGSEIWLAQTSSTPENAQSSDYAAESTGDKWWHKFGHSRRGLEHVVSVQEGRERQINVRTAIRALLEEQARQKMYKREDAEKLRKVSLNYTAWARDLALAAGHSDADAVTTEFSSARKTREFYLLKFALHQNTKNNVALHHVPGFMQPKVHAPVGGISSPAIAKSPRITQPHLLDANTAAQISFRRRKVAPKPETPATTPPPETEESSEPIKDPKPEDQSHESLAHRAAGFSVEGEKVDMAAVLSGMGAIPQEAHHKASATTPVAS